nr:MAG: hypothetical protein [Microvirus sp.]
MIYVVNLALKRPDGKVETDTFFTETLPDQETANNIAEKYSCDVLVAVVGTFKPYSAKLQESHAFVAKPKEIIENEIH